MCEATECPHFLITLAATGPIIAMEARFIAKTAPASFLPAFTTIIFCEIKVQSFSIRHILFFFV